MKAVQQLKNKIQRFPLSIHPAFFFVLIYCVFFGKLQAFATITILALIHEAGHAIVALRYGYKLKRVRLLPFGAELCGQDLFLPLHEIRIALAGPITNFGICLICVALMWVWPAAYSNLKLVFDCSLSLALFNLLPFFPLDGGRIFVALVSQKLGRDLALKTAKIFTIFFGIFLLILFSVSLFISFNLTFGIMGFSLVLSSIFISTNSKYERLTSASFKQKKLKSGLVQKHIAISENSSIYSAFSNVDARTQAVFCVQDDFGKEIIHLSESDIENAINKGAAYKKIGDYFVKNH